jgi:hypothetical protein
LLSGRRDRLSPYRDRAMCRTGLTAVNTLDLM